MKYDLEQKIVVGLIVILGIFCVVGVYFAAKAHGQWKEACVAAGGHVISDTDTHVGTGIDSSGKPVTTTTTSTDYWCISEDGRILDIE